MDTLKTELLVFGVIAIVASVLGDKQQTCSRLHDDIYEKIKKVQGGDHIYPLIPYDDDEGEYGMIDINVDEFVDEMLGWERKEDGKGWEKTKEIPEGIREKCREYRDHECRRELGLRDYHDRLEEDDEDVEGAENREKKWEEEAEAAHHKNDKDRKSEMEFVSFLCENDEVRM